MFDANNVAEVIASMDNDLWDDGEVAFWIGTDGDTMTLTEAVEDGESVTFRITVERIA